MATRLAQLETDIERVERLLENLEQEISTKESAKNPNSAEILNLLQSKMNAQNLESDYRKEYEAEHRKCHVIMNKDDIIKNNNYTVIRRSYVQSIDN
jgi:uncharacterized protein involved in exopolysaccharide biosynthesis